MSAPKGADISELFAQFVQFMGKQQAVANPSEVEDGVKGQGVKVVEDRSSVSSAAGFSWADEVEVAQSDSSLELKGAPKFVADVRKLRFGGLEDDDADQREVRGEVKSPGSGMSMYVKTQPARMMVLLLQSVKIKLPKKAQFDLALVTYSAATMPTFFRDGKARHRSLAGVGDAAFTLIAMSDAFANGMHVESAQHFRSTVLSDANMRTVFAGSQYRQYVSFGTNVDASTSKAGATAIEAIAGVVMTYCGLDAVRSLARQVGLSIAIS